MGYTTDFTGSFELDRPLDDDTYALLKGLSSTRRMKRQGLDPKYGTEGEFYFNPNSDDYGQERDESIVDYNAPPSTQPSLWCQWEPTKERTEIVWNQMEKFYNYTEWIAYLVDRILKPRGYVLNGAVEWQGEDSDDFGRIVIGNNAVFVHQGEKTYGIGHRINQEGA